MSDLLRLLAYVGVEAARDLVPHVIVIGKLRDKDKAIVGAVGLLIYEDLGELVTGLLPLYLAAAPKVECRYAGVATAKEHLAAHCCNGTGNADDPHALLRRGVGVGWACCYLHTQDHWEDTGCDVCEYADCDEAEARCPVIAPVRKALDAATAWLADPSAANEKAWRFFRLPEPWQPSPWAGRSHEDAITAAIELVGRDGLRRVVVELVSNPCPDARTDHCDETCPHCTGTGLVPK